MIIFLFKPIKFIIFLRNFFSDKKYKTCLVGKVIFIYRNNPDIVIQDYHFYVQSILLNALPNLNKQRLVFYECPGLRLLKRCLPYFDILLQIEHTLLHPKGGDGVIAVASNLKTNGSEEKYFIRIADFEKLNQSSIVIDYSRINLFNIKSTYLLRDFWLKCFCINPTLYRIDTNIDGRSGVITMFGDPSIHRRKLFIEELEKQAVEFKNIRGKYFGVDQVYRKTKILINIRQTDSFNTLEELRVLPALRSGVIVICEDAPYINKTAYSHFLILGSLEELPRLVKEIELNYEAVHQRIFGDGSENSFFVKRMRRIERCNILSMQKGIDYLNRL